MNEQHKKIDSHYEDLERVKSSLLKRFNWIEGRIGLYSDGDEEKIQRLINTQQRVSKSILDCIMLARNPRLGLSLEDEVEGDLARMLDRVRSCRDRILQKAESSGCNSTEGDPK